jgi:hypothetical protein
VSGEIGAERELVDREGNTRDRTIRISHTALARETGMRLSGAFVRGVRQLIARGVLVACRGLAAMPQTLSADLAAFPAPRRTSSDERSS